MNADTIRIMVYRHSAFYSPLIATVADFLKKEGVQAQYFPMPKERNLFDMFRKGEVDVMQAAVSTSWDPLSKRIPDIPVHFAQINQRDGFFITTRLLNQPFEWKALEKAQVLADHAPQPLAMFKYGLHLAGVDWKNVQLIDAGSPEAMVQAFRNGMGDYVHLQGPAAQQLEKDGIGRVVAALGEVIPPVAFSSLMATREFLKTAKAAAFKRAYSQALRYVIESPPEAIAPMVTPFFPDTDPDVVASTIGRYQRLGTWRPDPAITREQYETAVDVFLYSGAVSRRFPYEDVVVPFSESAS